MRKKPSASLDCVVIYSRSVEGGFSFALIESVPQKRATKLCEEMEEAFGVNFSCFKLKDLIRCRTGEKSVDRRMSEVLSESLSEVESGECEEFEGIDPSALNPPALLKPRNSELLYRLLDRFCDTGYSSGGMRDFIHKKGIAVLLCS